MQRKNSLLIIDKSRSKTIFLVIVKLSMHILSRLQREVRVIYFIKKWNMIFFLSIRVSYPLYQTLLLRIELTPRIKHLSKEVQSNPSLSISIVDLIITCDTHLFKVLIELRWQLYVLNNSRCKVLISSNIHAVTR